MANEITNQLQALQQLKGKLPQQVATIAVQHFKRNFKLQGFLDQRIKKWKKRKYQDGGRAILVKTGNLRRSIRVISTTRKRVRIGSDVPYAKIHNEGGSIRRSVRVRSHKRKGRNVRAHTRRININIPKRQFIGDSKALERKIGRHIEAKLNNIFNT